MNNLNKAAYPLIGSVLVVIGLILGLSLRETKYMYNSPEMSEYSQKLTDIIHILDKQYVDTIDKKQLFEKTITTLLHELDPHSSYIAAEDLAEMNEGIQGKFGGVGIRFTIYDDTLSVVNVVAGSPAYSVGVKKFDQIIEVDGENIAGVGLSNDKVRNMLKGKEGTPVDVVLLRENQILP